MGALIGSLVPLALGIVMSPLAIMALVAVLLSPRARTNGVAFLVGWALGLVLVLVLSLVLLQFLELHQQREPPLWVPVVRLVLGLSLVVWAVRVYQHGRQRVREMAAATSPREVAAAAPQLPGWLQRVSTFDPARTLALGVGIFVLNPVDASCAFLAAMDVQLAGLGTATSVAVLVVFSAVGVAPIAVPVAATLVLGERADPFLSRTRVWIAGHTSVLNAALLLVIGVLQVQKAVDALLG
ncbi:GAP family protein [Cellulomonas triticagri]|uniref:GAP family protein n=1 Tax=Cellulomonas triticagri TaxID=2483352 RepID=A0A3M2JW45_9CELL|nr:GAP family protein [Cellulomonas triticagri]RMI14288.1 hypothetical protein EBM89_00565 [Cellulomonas triticagri]